MAKRRTRGLSLTDVVVVLGVIGLLLAMAGRSVRNASDVANRVHCASNLLSIYKGLYLYSTHDKQGNFPRTAYVVGGQPTQYTGVTAADPFGAGGPVANDVTAGLFLVLRDQGMSAEVFICPSTTYKPWDFGGKSAQQCSNFPGNENLAYSVANPYPSVSASDGGYKWNNSLRADFGIMGDMNPGGAVLPTLTRDSSIEAIRQGNSKNHGGDGQNLCYGDGHVAFEKTPFVGVKRDCIYTTSPDDTQPNGGTISGPPGWFADTVLLPVATVDPGYVSAGRQMIYVAVGGAVIMGAVGLVLFLVLRKGKPARRAYGGAGYSNAGYPSAGQPQAGYPDFSSLGGVDQETQYAPPPAPPQPPPRRGPPPMPPRR